MSSAKVTIVGSWCADPPDIIFLPRQTKLTLCFSLTLSLFNLYNLVILRFEKSKLS